MISILRLYPYISQIQIPGISSNKVKELLTIKGAIIMERKELNKNLAQMLKGGVIMDVTNAEEAIIAEKAGACAVMALERVPSDIRKEGGVARMSDPKMIKEIQACCINSCYG